MHTEAQLATASAEQAYDMILGSAPPNEVGAWRERESALLGALLNALVALRDRGELDLSVQTLRRFTPLHQIALLERRSDLPEEAREALRRHLDSLPGYEGMDGPVPRATSRIVLHPRALDQHGFLQMGVLGMLDAYQEGEGDEIH